jgi:hypothetical protein
MSTFEQYQAGVRASDRMHCEADLYWRTNRWAEDGRDQVVTMKAGEITVMAAGHNVGRSTVVQFFNRAMAAADITERYQPLFKSNKSSLSRLGGFFDVEAPGMR